MTGVDGDFYLDNDTGDIYQKISGSWVLQMNIKGPKGDPGTVWLSGHGAPT